MTVPVVRPQGDVPPPQHLMRVPLQLGQRAMRTLAGAGPRGPEAQTVRRDAAALVEGLRSGIARTGYLREGQVRGDEFLARARRSLLLDELQEEKRSMEAEVPPSM